MSQKCQFFTFFGVTRPNLLGFRWNILTNEPVLERLLNFWIFETYFTLIAHLVRAREPPKVKKSKIRVTRKPDLETQNWVYSFSSFIEPYQTHIVTVQMLSTFFHLLDRVSGLHNDTNIGYPLGTVAEKKKLLAVKTPYLEIGFCSFWAFLLVFLH